ncbi:ABC transporter ATP-binding protein [Rhabdothermincola sediminis]|uniref:ABC transporter ATP-binding protein n=1 Tax=Rhabdothermincola sediminis TaxID=2751370 RepID=UPI001AA04B5F|nr:ABC transporter ATP-binding protein [Rhabdothermincola sediminis]
MLEVEDLAVTIDGRHILDGVSATVPPGGVLGVLGPSGSGKTTLLRAIAGLQPVERGSIRVDGRDLTPLPTHRRQVGLMFQDYALFPHLDVAGNVAFGLRVRGAGRAEQGARVGEVLELVGLSGCGSRAVSSLSGGERQRVALARALAPAPRVLMLDEPLGALDRALRERLLVELQELFANLEVSVVYVTHDQDEALSVAGEVALLREGRVVRRGPPAELRARPGDAWSARFLGFTNVFDVEVRDGTVLFEAGVLARAATQLPPGHGSVLVRPRGARLDAAGQLRGRVDAHLFTGDQTVVRVRLGERTTLDVLADGEAVPGVGTEVGVTVLPGAVEPLERG